MCGEGLYEWRYIDVHVYIHIIYMYMYAKKKHACVNTIVEFMFSMLYHLGLLPSQTPNLMSRGEGLMPSVLAFASEQNFIGPNMATVSDQPGR